MFAPFFTCKTSQQLDLHADVWRVNDFVCDAEVFPSNKPSDVACGFQLLRIYMAPGGRGEGRKPRPPDYDAINLLSGFFFFPGQ